jgi:hypothetical protein
MHSGPTLIGRRAHTASDIPGTHHVLQWSRVNINIHSKGKSLTPIEIAIAILINNKAGSVTSSSNEKLRATLRPSLANIGQNQCICIYIDILLIEVHKKYRDI